MPSCARQAARPDAGRKVCTDRQKRTNTRDAAIRHLGCLLPCIIFPHIFEQCRRKTHLICSIIDLSVYVTVRKPPLCKGSLDTLASHAQRRGAVKTSNDETAPKDLSYKPFLLRSIFSTSLKFAVGTWPGIGMIFSWMQSMMPSGCGKKNFSSSKAGVIQLREP